jgi:trimethylamine--corrinoid protein Co-methyltransferase
MIRGLQPGISTMQGWGLSMFTEDELFEIHLGTLDVLQNYGVGVVSLT